MRTIADKTKFGLRTCELAMLISKITVQSELKNVGF